MIELDPHRSVLEGILQAKAASTSRSGSAARAERRSSARAAGASMAARARLHSHLAARRDQSSRVVLEHVEQHFRGILQWQWAAAFYTQFSTDLNAIGVKPIDGDKNNPYTNSDHAGSPENLKAFVSGGARGGGGLTSPGRTPQRRRSLQVATRAAGAAGHSRSTERRAGPGGGRLVRLRGAPLLPLGVRGDTG